MDLKVFHDTIDLILRKNQGGFMSPEEKDLAINRAQAEVFYEYKPQYGESQQVNDVLLPFKGEQTFDPAASVGGLVTLNPDYVNLLSVETIVTDNAGTHYIPVEIMGEDEVSQRKSSALIPLTVYYPIGLLKSASTTGGRKRLQLYPAQTASGVIYYLRKPQEVQFVYTIPAPHQISYDQGNSKQLEWDDRGCEKVLYKTLQLLGMSTGDVQSVQFSQAKEAQNGNQ